MEIKRENIDKLSGIFLAVKRLVKTYENICIIYPVHSNEKIRSLAKKVFSDCERVYLSKPLSAYDFHNLLYRASVVMTDSGGVHEEATYLRKPTLILRDVTERKELFTNKNTKLVGTDENTIFSKAKVMLENIDITPDCNAPVNTLLGDGNASGIIADILENKLGQ